MKNIPRTKKDRGVVDHDSGNHRALSTNPQPSPSHAQDQGPPDRAKATLIAGEISAAFSDQPASDLAPKEPDNQPWAPRSLESHHRSGAPCKTTGPPTRKLATPAAATYLGLSKSTLDKMRMSGQGPPYLKLGRRVVYDIDDLEQWAAQMRRTQTSDVIV